MAAVAPQDAPYAFKRSFKGAMRLNFNHFYMTRLTEYLLHPKIPQNQEGVRIADLGTGTGIWASELAAKLPSSATIDAFDVSPDNFPPLAWRQSNVHYIQHDCFTPFPKEYLGQYDIIHIRFWVCMVNDAVAKPLLENFLTLLKPGGFIQWFDGLPLTTNTKSRNGDAPTPACEQLVSMMKKPLPHSSFNWVEALPGLFEEQGLDLVARELYRIPDHYQVLGAQSQLAGLDDFVYQEKEGGKASQFQNQLAAEQSAGAFVDHAYTCVVGRKLRLA